MIILPHNAADEKSPKGSDPIVNPNSALEQNSYEDARQMLLDMEKWFRGINESATDSLLEAIEEILTLHWLKIPGLPRKTLHSTNPIESMFSTVRDAEGNIRRYRNSTMMRRWLASVLPDCERVQTDQRGCFDS